MELRLRPGLLFSELCCCRITVVRGVFVLHVLSSNIFSLLIFQEKHKNKKHCSVQDIGTSWGIKKEVNSFIFILITSRVQSKCYIFLGFVLRYAAFSFIFCYKGIIRGNAGYATWLT